MASEHSDPSDRLSQILEDQFALAYSGVASISETDDMPYAIFDWFRVRLRDQKKAEQQALDGTADTFAGLESAPRPNR